MVQKKTPGVYRTTISISADLKRRMDKAGLDVNWSAIAAQAFESKLAEIAAKKERKNMDDVVQRLRASKAASENEMFKDGFEAGQEWAKHDAEAIELQRLDKAKENAGRDWDGLFNSEGNAYCAAEWVVFDIRPDDDRDREAATSFWEDTLGDDSRKADDDEFVRGFVEGALNVWDEVKAAI